MASGPQGVVCAARSGKDGESPMSETKRDYEVGRGKPPVYSRFKKGQSGNPRGPRPKSLPALLVDALNEFGDSSNRTPRARGAGAILLSPVALDGARRELHHPGRLCRRR